MPEQRASIENGIWLCQSCAKLVDADELRYPAGVLEEWKMMAEAAALLDLQQPSSTVPAQDADVELLRFFSQCFDRPAFQDPFRQEVSVEAFDRAIEDTITAINTGCLRSRQRQVLNQGRGKAFLRRYDWRRDMDMIVDLLRAIRSRFAYALNAGEIQVHRGGETDFYILKGPEVAEWMDETRAQILDLFSRLCQQAGLPGFVFPRHFRRFRHW